MDVEDEVGFWMEGGYTWAVGGNIDCEGGSEGCAGIDVEGESVGCDEKESDGVRGTEEGMSMEGTDIMFIMACDWRSMCVVASSMAAVGSGLVAGSR